MDPNYTKLVLYDYEQKRAKNLLSLALSNPAPAKLKKECFKVCGERFSRKDGRALSDFFGEGDDKEAVLKAIKRCHAGKFKPLRNFLKKETESTDDKNIELLAWLIDFKERPYDYSKNYNVDNLEPITIQGEENNKEEHEATPLEKVNPEEEQPAAEPVQTDAEVFEDLSRLEVKDLVTSGEAKSDQGEKEAIVKEPDQSEASAGEAGSISDPGEEPPMQLATPKPEGRKPGSVFKRGLAVLAITLLAIAGFWFYQDGKTKERERIPMGQVLPETNACMYWTGDHYEQIPCRGTTGDTLVEPLDPEKIRSFKKITRPDTITRQSKGSVWYVKINGGKEIEFYTSGGFHPIDRRLRLKPITDYMIGKYIHPDLQDTDN